MVLGHKVFGSLEMLTFKEGNHRLMRTHFSHRAMVKRFSLIEEIKVQRWNNVEDIVKLEILYVIHTYINITRTTTKITTHDFSIIKLDLYADYPSGLALFRLL